jgi:hypothetical protein
MTFTVTRHVVDGKVFYSAEDHVNGVFYNAPTPTEAVAGAQIMAAIDRTLPFDEENEDARAEVWHTITDAVVKALFREENPND